MLYFILGLIIFISLYTNFLLNFYKKYINYKKNNSSAPKNTAKIYEVAKTYKNDDEQIQDSYKNFKKIICLINFDNIYETLSNKERANLEAVGNWLFLSGCNGIKTS